MKDMSTSNDVVKRSLSRRSLRRSLKTMQSIMGTLALPLVLGIFTVIITFQQKTDAAKQRMEDRQQANEEREQDLNLSRLQRISDLNQSSLQRQLDRTLADEKRQQDYELANETRQLSAVQRQHEIYLEVQRYQDPILVSYMNEISVLLRENKGSLTQDPLIATLVRLKTLTIIRRLDPPRNSEVIRFLYEAGQLNSSGDHIDLSYAELNGIDLSSTIPRKKMHYLYLVGVSLRNSSFVNRDLTGANFHMSILKGANMSDTILNNADMSNIVLDQLSQFIGSRLDQINFRETQMYGIDFSTSLSMNSGTFQNSEISHCRFSGLSLKSTVFSKSIFKYLDFSFANLEAAQIHDTTGWHINFTNANLREVSFLQTTFYNSVFDNVQNSRSVNFHLVRLYHTTFRSSTLNTIRFKEVSMIDVDFSHAKFRDAIYDNCNLDGSIFDNLHSVIVRFQSCTLRGANLSNMHVDDSLTFALSDLSGAQFRQEYSKLNFTYCNLTHTNFVGTTLLNVNFTGNNLAFTNMSHAKLTNVHFQLMNNFSHADLRNTSGITEDVFHSALSLDNTYLPNGTQLKDNPELLRNGHAQCHVPIENDWIIEEGNIVVQPLIKNEQNCYFMPVNVSSDSLPFMSQHVNISRYRTIIMKNRAAVLYRARLSQLTYIYIEQLNAIGSVLHSDGSSVTSPSQLIISRRIQLQQNTHELKVSIVFLESSSSNDLIVSQWVHFIEIKIDLRIDRNVS